MNKLTTITLSAVGGGVLGGVVTYLTVNRALRTRYEDWANEEINSVKARYAQLNADNKSSFVQLATDPSPEIQEAVEVGKKLIEQMGYSPADPDEPRQETLSIFDQAVDPDEDEETTDPGDAYLSQMDKGYQAVDGEPHLISEDEFFENNPEYELDTLTYYTVDNTLCDNQNVLVPDADRVIGGRHLHMFPKVKGDEKSSIYVRNDEHQTLYEVIQVENSYAVVVLDMDEEELGLKEPKKRLKKMRDDD